MEIVNDFSTNNFCWLWEKQINSFFTPSIPFNWFILFLLPESLTFGKKEKYMRWIAIFIATFPIELDYIYVRAWVRRAFVGLVAFYKEISHVMSIIVYLSCVFNPLYSLWIANGISKEVRFLVTGEEWAQRSGYCSNSILSDFLSQIFITQSP